jgi:hypothetical protein
MFSYAAAALLGLRLGAALIAVFLGIKIVTEFFGTPPLTRYFNFKPREGMNTTLMMSMGLTFG